MHGISICETCGKEYNWRRVNGSKPPRFCQFSCKSYIGLKTRTRNSELTDEQNLERIKKYFNKYVIKQEGCWDWSGTIQWTGYATLNIRPPIKAHRASWILNYGSIPEGKLVCHTCDNRKCTNPEHLWLGTYEENIADKFKKGRSNTPKGSQLKVSQLNEEQVLEIKVFLKNGLTCGEIARQYGVSRKIISRIKNNDTWKHI